MTKKLDKLKEWKEQISAFPELSIEEARALYIEAINAKDEREKKELMDKVIQGTLYVVFNFIKRNRLNYIKSSSYDLEDLINSCFELWVKEIQSGALLKEKFFSHIIDYSFCSNLASMLNETNLGTIDLTLFNSEDFINAFYDYVNYHKESGGVSFFEFCKFISRFSSKQEEDSYICLCRRINDLAFSDSDFAQQTYELFENIIDAIKDENDDINITKTKIDKFKHLLIDAGLNGFRVNIDNVYETDFSDGLVYSSLMKEFVDTVFSSTGLDDRKKDIMYRHLGFNGHREDFKSVADSYNVTEARARQLYNKAIKSLRANPAVLKYRKDLYKQR